MSVYDRQIVSAKRLIEAKGQNVIWRVLRDGAPIDESMPWKPTTRIQDDNNVKIVFLPFTILNRQLFKYMKESEVTEGFLTGLMGAVDFEPKIKDVVIRDGKELFVKSIDVLAPNGEIIIYTLNFEEGGFAESSLNNSVPIALEYIDNFSNDVLPTELK